MADTSTVTEVTKQILDKLSEAAHAAQTTVEVALPHVVKAYMYRQIGYTMAGLLCFCIAAVLLANIKGKPFEHDNGDPDIKVIVSLIFGGFLGVAGVITTLCNLGPTFGVIGDPLGMFILDLVKK